MALWHAFKPLKLELNGEEVEILNDSNAINYYPQKKLLMSVTTQVIKVNFYSFLLKSINE